jgi:hypothetical protein
VAAFFWVIEEDSGGVAGKAKSIEEDFLEACMKQAVTLYDFGSPRGCVPFAAFHRTLVPFSGKLKDAAHVRFRNDDDVGDPREFFFKLEGVNLTGHSGRVLRNLFAPGCAIYNLYFDYSYKPVAVADL